MTKAKKKVGRPRGVQAKVRGSAMTRRTVRQIARRILAETSDCTVEEGAQRLGLAHHDIKNLRAGNLPSLQLILRLIEKGRYNPEALIFEDELRKLPPRLSTRQAQRRAINARVRKLAIEGDAPMLAKATGLSIYNIYQLRVGNRPPGIHTVLGFIDAGISPNQIFLGKASSRR
jgi:hypothetical protein